MTNEEINDLVTERGGPISAIELLISNLSDKNNAKIIILALFVYIHSLYL